MNTDLIDTYESIKHNVDELIKILQKLQLEYYNLLHNEEQKKEYYYSKRGLFNQRKTSKIEQSALFIFLNKTCFNGLFRVNKKNEFNVPIGNYKNPLICDENNLLIVSELLQKVKFLKGYFEETINHKDNNNTLFYFDPFYKPLSETSRYYSKKCVRLVLKCKFISIQFFALGIAVKILFVRDEQKYWN